MTRVVVHIDRIVLHGVPPSQQKALVSEFVQTLERELARDGAADRVAGVGHLATARARFSATPDATSVGRGAARRVAGALQR